MIGRRKKIENCTNLTGSFSSLSATVKINEGMDEDGILKRKLPNAKLCKRNYLNKKQPVWHLRYLKRFFVSEAGLKTEIEYDDDR